jgi:hypothetical protein
MTTGGETSPRFLYWITTCYAHTIQHPRHQHPARDGKDEGQHRRNNYPDPSPNADPNKGIQDWVGLHHFSAGINALQFITRGRVLKSVLITRCRGIGVALGCGAFGAQPSARGSDRKFTERTDRSDHKKDGQNTTADERDQNKPDHTSRDRTGLYITAHVFSISIPVKNASRHIPL